MSKEEKNYTGISYTLNNITVDECDKITEVLKSNTNAVIDEEPNWVTSRGGYPNATFVRRCIVKGLFATAFKRPLVLGPFRPSIVESYQASVDALDDKGYALLIPFEFPINSSCRVADPDDLTEATREFFIFTVFDNNGFSSLTICVKDPLLENSFAIIYRQRFRLLLKEEPIREEASVAE